MVRLCTYWDLKRELIPWIGGRKVGTHRRGRRFVPADFLPRRFAHIRFGRAEGFSLAVWLGGPTCVVRTTLRVGPLPSATTQNSTGALSGRRQVFLFATDQVNTKATRPEQSRTETAPWSRACRRVTAHHWREAQFRLPGARSELNPDRHSPGCRSTRVGRI
jgi:hypothetical protein